MATEKIVVQRLLTVLGVPNGMMQINATPRLPPKMAHGI
jgi:hypothetical protein